MPPNGLKQAAVPAVSDDGAACLDHAAFESTSTIFQV